MRVNVYAEEMTDLVEIVSKEKNGQVFTGLRIYLQLPVTIQNPQGETTGQLRGPFLHGPDDDDSSAVTIWGKKDLRKVLQKAIAQLDTFYGVPVDHSTP